MSDEAAESIGERRRDPGPSGKAYRRNNVFSIVLLLFVILLAIFSVANTIIEAENTEDKDFAIREGQYDACVQSGNVFRDDVRQEFVDLKRQVLIPVFDGVALTIPGPSKPGTAKAILESNVDYLRRRIATIEDRLPDTDCLRQYPPLEGQTYG
jgi:hypothetical protein